MLTIFFMISGSCKDHVPSPPVAEKIPHEITTHGHTRIDNYYWLRERENPEVIGYLEEENEYTTKMLRHTEELQENLYNEIIGRIKQTDESVPYFDNGYYYYTRYEEGFEFPVYCRRKGSMDADEEIMLNVNDMAGGHSFFQVAGLNVSPDNRILAFGIDTVGRRRYALHFKDLVTGELLSDMISETNGYVAWSNDSRTLFYTTQNNITLRAENVYRHALGDDPASRRLVYHEDDETYRVAVFTTKSKEYVMIVSSSTLSTEYRYVSAGDPFSDFRVFHPRESDMRYSVDHHGGRFYIVTNWEAVNFRLMETPEGRTGKEHWKELVGHRDDVLLSGIEIFNDHLVLSERKNGLRQIYIYNWDDMSGHYLEFPEEVYTAAVSVNPDFDSDMLRYSYSSLTTPNSVFDYNMKTGERVLLKQDEVIGDFDPDNYQARRLYATAGDGTKIPVSLVYRKGIERDGSNPLLLYAYGSYGSSTDPRFSSVRLSLLDRGFIYAIAHVRGGQEMGRYWYEEGKLLNKKNTFTDFNDCAQYLIDQNYTNQRMLFARGGSAGGLLIGAVINMRPDLYRGVIAAVPFVDVVTTMLDESIPLTTSEYDEWGNPNIEEFYHYMLSYSPYDQVTRQGYPAMLVTTGLHDSQVQYWEPAKWVAKLREYKTCDNPLLLYTNMEAGHGGAAGRYRRYREIAMEYAFLIDLAGVK
ncbi:MAG: S9 family peptidase [Marinilabiliales bacterium]|nr:MAG: S9 family peptidase [Marinilabiliales bacterium]